MPANSFLGVAANMVDLSATAAFTFSRTATYAALRAIPVTTGSVLTLPDNPSKGDMYAWGDADLSCSSTHPITIHAGAGQTIRGAVSIAFTIAGSAGFAVYDNVTNSWFVYQSASGLAGAPNRVAGSTIAGTVVAAAGQVVLAASFTPKVTGKVRVIGSATWQAGAGNVTPVLQHQNHGGGGLVTDQAFSQWTANAVAGNSWGLEIDGLTVGTALDFFLATTAGDRAITLGAGAAAAGATILVEELA